MMNMTRVVVADGVDGNDAHCHDHDKEPFGSFPGSTTSMCTSLLGWVVVVVVGRGTDGREWKSERNKPKKERSNRVYGIG